jgi:UDP-glucose 4-epimerase
VGATEETTIEALARRVAKLAGSASEIVVIPYDEAYEPGFEDMARRVPKVAKIGELLDWSARRSLDEIIEDVIEHHRASGEAS